MYTIKDSEIRRLIENNSIDIRRFEGKTILITGATGLIGKNLVMFLYRACELYRVNVRIKVLVRNKDKAEMMFGGISGVEICVSDVKDPSWAETCAADYIVHAASPTQSRSFIEDPVGVINSAYRGTVNALECAKKNRCSSMVYLSSMEVYGSPQNNELIGEDHSTNIDTSKVRSSYPESKRMCETLCTAYCSQYGIPVKVLRLTQTFGPGVEYTDRRVFAEFGRACAEKKDIVLKTKGATMRKYLHVYDACTAILKVLLDGENGQAYNAARNDSLCSISEMAYRVKNLAGGDIDVLFEQGNTDQYAPEMIMNLDCRKLRSLGWDAEYGIDDMFKDMIRCWEETQNA